MDIIFAKYIYHRLYIESCSIYQILKYKKHFIAILYKPKIKSKYKKSIFAIINATSFYQKSYLKNL